MRKTFISFIRPILEFNSNIWNQSFKYLIDNILIVQRHFTKHIPSISSLTNLERLGVLGLEPLEQRRLRFDFLQYYKILYNLPLQFSSFLTGSVFFVIQCLFYRSLRSLFG